MITLGTPPRLLDFEEDPRVMAYTRRGCIGPILRGRLCGFAIAADDLKDPTTVQIVEDVEATGKRPPACTPSTVWRRHHLVLWSAQIEPGRTITVSPAPAHLIAEDDDRLFWRLIDWKARAERGEHITVSTRIELPQEDPLVAVARRAVEPDIMDRHAGAIARLLARETETSL